MKDYLILVLDGVLQTWGRETLEGLRPSELCPGRSGLLGLLGACLGIERNDHENQRQLAVSVKFAVRIDNSKKNQKSETDEKEQQKMTDYHTVKDARVDYSGLKSHNTIETWREYWQDARYTVAVWLTDKAELSLQDLENAVKYPVYTPVLGRRSCPLSRPLFEEYLKAKNALEALRQIKPGTGIIYSDEKEDDRAIPLRKRDVPIINQPRQFASRYLYMTKT